METILKNKKVGTGIAILALSSLSPSAQAASSSSGWSPNSSWSGSSDSSSVAHRSLKGRDGSGELSPFAPGSHNVSLDVGQVFLMGGLNKYSDSIGTQVHYNYGVSDLFDFDSSVGYSEHSDGKFNMASLRAGLRLNLSWYDKVVPFATFGLGFYRPNYHDDTVKTAAPTTPASPGTKQNEGPPSLNAVLFGIYVGPGVDLELSKNMFFGAAVTFHNSFQTSKLMADGKTTLDLGGTYTSFFLHIGATF